MSIQTNKVLHSEGTNDMEDVLENSFSNLEEEDDEINQ